MKLADIKNNKGMNNSKPTARIAVKKSVVKVHDKNKDRKVYLPNDQEFQIEFFNPTEEPVAAEVYINGKKEFNSWLVINPGVREWLDCNPETNKRFKFSTYEVESGNSAVEKAIAMNGKVEVRFHKREEVPSGINVYVPNLPVFGQNFPYDRTYVSNPYNYPNSSPIYGTCNTTVSTGDVTLTGSLTTQSISGASNTSSIASNLRSKSLSRGAGNSEKKFFGASLDNLDLEFEGDVLEDKVEMKETGRIAEGAHSDQSFKVSGEKFVSYAWHTEMTQILPLSERPVQISKVRHCPACRTKAKKGDRFCGQCGTII